MPRDVADEVRSQEKRALAKEVREDASVKAKVAKARERRVVAWQVERWKDGKLVSTTQELETEEEADGDEEIDWEEDEPVRVRVQLAINSLCFFLPSFAFLLARSMHLDFSHC